MKPKQKEIARLYTALETAKPGSEDYDAIQNQLREFEKPGEVFATEGLRLAGRIGIVIAILIFERSGAITSKAFGLIRD